MTESIDYDKLFKQYLPDTLFSTHYELAELYGGTPIEWRAYLRDNQRFIDSEVAALAEPAARAALNRLSNAASSEVAALKAILEKSKLINESQKQAEKVIITFIPPHDFKEEPKPIEPPKPEPEPIKEEEPSTADLVPTSSQDRFAAEQERLRKEEELRKEFHIRRVGRRGQSDRGTD